MLHQIRTYLHFLLHSTNQHGVHSPFVYDLVTKCFYDKRHYEKYTVLDAHRKALLKDTRSIHVKDFGAGSRVFKTDERAIQSIAKHVGSTPKLQYLLYRLAQYFHPKQILELGTSLGMGTLAMTLGASKGILTSLEGCPETARTAREYMEAYSLKPKIVTTEFIDFLKVDEAEYDMVYVDGHHNYEATLNYFNILLGKVNSNSLIIFDDIHWSQEMTDAWNEIVKHPNVTVSIDTFHWGLVFFRKEQPKQHFRIRL